MRCGQAKQMATLYFYHDPMCSWCWGYRPVSDRLFASLPNSVELVKIVGGLAPDSDEPMPQNLLEGLPKAWSRIHDLLGTEFNFDFWSKCKPRRSTYPACRAVLAADNQNKYDEMIDAIQHAYYLRAMNPSDLVTLETLAGSLSWMQTGSSATFVRQKSKKNCNGRSTLRGSRQSMAFRHWSWMLLVRW